MALISLRGVHLDFGGAPLLDGVDLHVEDGDRICLLGINGAGKSTLLKTMAGLISPDAGDVARSAGVRVSYLPQDVPSQTEGHALDVVCPYSDRDPDGLHRLAAEQMLRRQGLDPAADFATLSGGSRRRVLLAKAMLGEPDVVMLDEPTNHLDFDAIAWLETHLLRCCRTFVFVTHDRTFLRRVANRIIELDRGRIVDWACDYDTFLRRKADVLADEQRLWDKFDTKLKAEEAWRRQGCKARTSRNQGRLRRLESMRDERAERRTAPGAVQMAVQESGRSGQVVLKAQGVQFGFAPDRPLIRNLDTVVMRGDRIGILGPNGCGKTTLIRLLLGDAVEPQVGRIVRGTNLQVAYSDQLRGQLDDGATLVESVAEDREFVMINGTRRHVVGYLGDFLFSPDRVRQPVGSLSGGERSRLLLARLFAQPSNVLVLDEPTNDLDLDTLDLLEEQIEGYGGTVIAVSHDRSFLNNVVTSTLAFEKFQPEQPDRWLGPDEGWSVNEYAGGFDDWVARRRLPPETVPDAKPRKIADPERNAAPKRGISYNERRELAELPARIEVLDLELADLHAQLADPEAYRGGDTTRVPRLTARLQAVEGELAAAYARWEELESRSLR
jgi:ATP-binding cassette subfamily F protein uup